MKMINKVVELVKKILCKHEFHFIPYVGNVSDYCCKRCGKVKRF